jgi:hypothetical protein
MNRRSLIKLGAGTLLGLGLSAACGRKQERPGHEPAPSPPPAPPPALRYCMVLFMRGGIDAMYTTDPREPAEVEAGVDVPFARDGIVTDGAVRLGPHLAPLRAHLPRMAILNGVRVHTANHETGAAQVLRLRTGVLPAMPGILDLVGRRRDGQPLGCVSLGILRDGEFSRRWFSDEQLRQLHVMPAEDRQVLAASLRRQADRLAKTTSEQRLTGESLRECAAFVEATLGIPRFQARAWPGPPTVQREATSLQQALWLLEHDLTRTVYVKAYQRWDSHERNHEGQTGASGPFFPLLAHFLGELGRRRNRFGSLADQTLIVALSEVGRFPRLNSDQGKDHFPEVPVLFIGPRVAGHARYGATGRNLEARPISLRTGHEPSDGTAGQHVLLDDVGATVLQAFGVNPGTHGYHGRILDFLGLA